MLGALPFNDDGGFLGGTNNKDLVGYGNLFMLGTEDAYMTGVNVYLPSKPTKFKEGASLKVQVWMTNITETNIEMTYMPIEGAILPMANIRTKADGAWVPVSGGAVAEFKFEEPLSLYGKTIFFVSVEGFSNDPATEDFCILTDLIGKPLNEEQAANLLCHNSFARMNGENDYLRPISSYGGGTGSFAICPTISIPGIKGGGIKENNATSNSFRVISSNKNEICVYSDIDGQLEIFNMLGRKVAHNEISEGNTTMTLPNLESGIYLIKGPNMKTIKIIL